MTQPQSPSPSSPKPLQNLPADLMARIRGAAHNIAFQYHADPDDVEQDIVLAILERYAGEPGFLQQTDAYIVNFGAWRARDMLGRQTRQHNREIEDEPLGDDDGATVLEMVEVDSWPEVEMGMAIRQALAGMDEQDRQICNGLAGGYSTREIAPAVGVCLKTVYNRMNGPIAEALEAL